jgi:phosphoribosylamine--glycine ligase
MNIMLIGGGGREHALAYALAKSQLVESIYNAPGNPGILSICKPAPIDWKNKSELVGFCRNKAIDLVVIGPEQPLAEGIADDLLYAGVPCFGPPKAAAMLESSKVFAKEFMKKHKIPTAEFQSFNKDHANIAHDYIDSIELPVVIKADGLAAGKGVLICETYREAHQTLDSVFSGLFKEAGNSVVIEEFMDGQEASILAVTDGDDFIILPSSQDHKRVLEGDLGKNTGGMGAYSPAPIVNNEVLEFVRKKILSPAITGIAQDGYPFHGCLYAGLMIKNNTAKVVEFNVRFGDPETQAVIPLIEGDFTKLLFSASIGRLDKTAVTISEGSSCCVVLASSGYPDAFEKGFEITGIEDAEKDGAMVFHAGTAMAGNKLVTAGGRVLGVCYKGDTLRSAVDGAYEAVDKIHFDNKYFRKDIAKRAL